MVISVGYNGYSTDKLSEGRVGLFLCECGCGQEFFANYRTRQPRYANKTHRARAYRARSRAHALAMDWWNRDGYYVDGKSFSDVYNEELLRLMSRNRGRG